MLPPLRISGLGVLPRRQGFVSINLRPYVRQTTSDPRRSIRRFSTDKLPDSAGARVPVVAALFSVSTPTVWRWSRDGKLPAPMKRGGVTLWNVGALRRCLADGQRGDGARTAVATAVAAARRSTAPAV